MVEKVILTRTPLRISFCGGGSDLPAYYRHEAGAVIGAAIDKYVHVVVKPNFDGRVLAHYRATEDVQLVSGLKHDRMRACLLRTGIEHSIEVASLADVPGSTGLGSSSAFTVGLLHALYPDADTALLARAACEVEIIDCKAPIGKQDQYFAAFGGLRFMQFHADEAVEIDSVQAPPNFLDHLLLLATPYTHNASAILQQQSAAMGNDRTWAKVRAMVNLAYAFRDALETGRLNDCGAILDEAWRRKRSVSAGITTDTIDRYYDAARDAGAWGGKLCGAGGGGFLLFMAPPGQHAAIAQATGLRHVPFAFDYGGSRVVYDTAHL